MLSILKRKELKKVKINLFKSRSITFLDEKWNVLEKGVKVKHLPRVHELVFRTDGQYYRVVNIIHDLNNKKVVFIIIEKYTDDFKLTESKT